MITEDSTEPRGAEPPPMPAVPQPVGPQPPADGYWRIEQVAARTGLTKRTLRYYEEIGLLAPPTRTEGGYRLYNQADIRHLERIKRMRDLLGFSLAEIREMVEAEEEREQAREAWRQATEPHIRLESLDRSTALTERQLRLVEEKLAGLEEMRTTLRARLERHAASRAELRAQIGRAGDDGQGPNG